MTKSKSKSKASSTKAASSIGNSPNADERTPPQTPPLPPAPQSTTPATSTQQLIVVPLPNMPTGENIFYEPPPGCGRKYRSKVWEHFTSYWVRTYKKVKNEKTKKYEDVAEFKERAKCKYCPKHLGDFAAESGPNGTGGLLKHIPKRCKFYPATADLRKQKILNWERGDYNQLVSRGFSQKDTMEACVEMVVIDELPFSFVKKKGFRKFCRTGMPLFKVPSRRTLVQTFLEMYESKKKKLRRELSAYRVCLTIDTWTSVQNINYMVITAHFIDSDWRMHKRVLSFCVIPNHQGATIADMLEDSLNEWGIKKLGTITVDNASTNKTALDLLARKLNDYEDPPTWIKGKHMHVRCVAHITNLIVGSGMKKLNPSILAIRNAVRFVRSSPNRLDYFKKAVAREKLPFKGLCCLDVPTRWNSTYMMLDSALRLKKAFKRMEQDQNSPYTAYFKEPEEMFDEEGNVIVQKKETSKVGPPSDVDWEACEAFVSFLRVFYDVTLKVSASLHPTIQTTVHDIIQMEETMNASFTGLQTPNDRLMAEVSSLMKTKYNKYFGKLSELNPMIIVGLVLDPRFKLQHVMEIMQDLQWDEYEVEEKIADIKQLMFDIYEEYDQKNVKKRASGSFETISSNTPIMKKQKLREGSSSGSGRVSSSISGLKYVMKWARRVEETEDAIVEHEIDRYLRDKVLAIMGKSGVEGSSSSTTEVSSSEPFASDLAEKYRSFDILQWWKKAACQYPILAQMAKDIFAIQVSTVASESAFSTSGRVIDAFRSSLSTGSVEALICMQNWLRGDDIIMDFEDEPCAEELEFYEDIEEELRSTKAKASASSSNSNSAGQSDPNARGKAPMNAAEDLSEENSEEGDSEDDSDED